MNKYIIKVNGDVKRSKMVNAESLDKALEQAKIYLQGTNYTCSVFEIPSDIQSLNFL
jgi:hypothetical protein